MANNCREVIVINQAIVLNRMFVFQGLLVLSWLQEMENVTRYNMLLASRVSSMTAQGLIVDFHGVA